MLYILYMHVTYPCKTVATVQTYHMSHLPLLWKMWGIARTT